ncbi:MAG: CvpA family protein [Chromatiales bacterium]|nr:CvpA family protein [Chromatiales bacterium]
MNWADYVILGVILLSAIVSLLRGFVREAFSLATWIAAIWLGILYAPLLAVQLEAYIAVPSLRLAAAFGAIFLITLLIGGLLNSLLGHLVDKSGLSGTDRVLGVLFGGARGVLIVAVLVLLAGATPFPNDPWWKESVLIPHFEQLAEQIRAFLPEDMAQSIAYTRHQSS